MTENIINYLLSIGFSRENIITENTQKLLIKNARDNNHTHITERAIISGNIIELFYYENGYDKNYSSPHIVGRASKTATDDDKKINREKVLMRARSNIRRLANANADTLTKFFTLTFKDNITDLKTANNLFHTFVVKMNYYLKINNLPKFEYIAVVEFQKRGAIHYHLLCNLPFVKAKQLAKIWGNGFVKINKIDDVDNVGAYITKYMSKDNDDTRLQGNRSYFTSQGLKQPIEIVDSEQIQKALAGCAPIKEPYSVMYENDYLGKIFYKQIVCKN